MVKKKGMPKAKPFNLVKDMSPNPSPAGMDLFFKIKRKVNVVNAARGTSI